MADDIIAVDAVIVVEVEVLDAPLAADEVGIISTYRKQP
jgi:hypothetical protein